MGLFGIIIAILLLFVLAYIGLPVLLLSIVCALIVALTNGMPLLETMTEVFMPGAANSFNLIFIVGILGAIIAEFYKVSGGASAIARGLLRGSKKIFRDSTSVTVPVTVITAIGMVLCYGGINGVIAVIIMMPIVMEIMKTYDMPRYLAPGIILGATCTAAMTMPGSPQSQNVIPSLYLGTSPTAGLIPGVIAGIVVIALNIVVMSTLAKKAIKGGDHYSELPPELAVPQMPEDRLPNVWISLIPLVATFVLYVIVRANIVVALAAGVVLCFPCFWKQIKTFSGFCKVLTNGSMDSCGLLMVVCLLSGFGAVVAATDSFTALCEALTTIPGPATFKALIAMAITVMVAGSGPAGEMAGVPMFSSIFGEIGVSPAAFHRIAAFTGTCLDTLPSNAGVNIASKLSGHSVKETYKYCFLTTVLATSIGAIVVTLLLTLFPNLA